MLDVSGQADSFLACVFSSVSMRDLAAQVTSSLLRFPEVTIDALGEDEVTLDSVLHGRFTVGESWFSLMACTYHHLTTCMNLSCILDVSCMFPRLLLDLQFSCVSLTSLIYWVQGKVDWPGLPAGLNWKWSMLLLESVSLPTASAGCPSTLPQCWPCGTSVG